MQGAGRPELEKIGDFMCGPHAERLEIRVSPAMRSLLEDRSRATGSNVAGIVRLAIGA